MDPHLSCPSEVSRKREASQEPQDALQPPVSKQRVDQEEVQPNCPPPSSALHSFTHLLGQYEYLEALASHMSAKDLLSLALTSRTAYGNIIERCKNEAPRLRQNLVKHTICDGAGVRLRETQHQPYDGYQKSDNATQLYVKCGSDDSSRSVLTQPCADCRLNTCDECRVHIIYQSRYEPRHAPDELPYWSGFCLLSSREMPILSPEHVPDLASRDKIKDMTAWKEPVQDVLRPDPHHDKGYLCAPFQPPCNCFYKWESLFPPLPNLLDMNLGKPMFWSFTASLQSHQLHHPIIEICEARKRAYCAGCKPSSEQACHCTLRSQFLDPWMCLPCFKRKYDPTEPNKHRAGFDQYRCAKCNEWCSGSFSIECSWCDGLCEG